MRMSRMIQELQKLIPVWGDMELAIPNDNGTEANTVQGLTAVVFKQEAHKDRMLILTNKSLYHINRRAVKDSELKPI